MKTGKIVILVGTMAFVLFALNPSWAIQDESEKEHSKPIDEELLKQHDDDEKPLEKIGQSVTIQQEFSFSRRQNIDAFLGEYENPFRPLRSVYDKPDRSEKTYRNDSFNRSGNRY